MATCRDIVTDALKLARVISPGESPTSDESDDGMIALQSFYDALATGGMFGELEDVYLDADDVAEEGKRYYVPSGITLTAPTSEYVDSDSVTRQPRDLSMYESLASDGTHVRKLYDRTAWVSLLGLTLNDDAPLSGRGRTGLAAALATSGAFAAMFSDTATLNPDVRRIADTFTGSVMKPATTRERQRPEYF